jgi:hypothetical protein
MTQKTVRSLVVRSFFAAVVGAAVLAPTAASAQFVLPPLGPTDNPNLVAGGNRWTITFYNDASPNHDQWATQGICFRFIGTVGTHNRYQWWSDTFPDWNGIASQEGDQVFMHGDYANDVGHDGITWEIVTASARNVGAGHWHEWRENGAFGNTIGFGNAQLARVGSCRLTLDEAKLIAIPFDYRTNRLMESPMGNPDIEILKQ